ncbi:hypothetical protein AK812_SmicGene11696 [Symbiodinium microadriaticum]|uniref:Uncharacterized protein n=1 Tax=Symbiodinium microadriaticum TaxID=2951 RepID=A0A1Q9ECP9_SYMMI|nr:hypothetical protein AK812_SmicGene11696 [Symbiodinium microadriaticum]
MALAPFPPAPPPPYPSARAAGSLQGNIGLAAEGLSVVPATLGDAPRSGRALRVEPEDCLDPLQLGTTAQSPSPRRSSPPSYRGRAVYMQKVGDPSQFKAIAPERATRLGLGSQHETGGGRGRRASDATAALEKRASAFLSDALPLPAVQAAMDAEVAKLFRSTAEADREIFGLAVAAERSRLLSRVVSALVQGGMFFLCLLSALMIPETGSEHLEAYLRSMLLTCSQFCLVINILQAVQGYERALSGQRGAGAYNEDKDLRRSAWPAVANAAVAATANASVLLCCLLGEAAFATDGTGRATLRGVQAGFGILAIWPVMLDLRQLVTPWLPVPALIRLMGSASVSGEDRRARQGAAAT